jgi:hypothetical protein
MLSLEVVKMKAVYKSLRRMCLWCPIPQTRMSALHERGLNGIEIF